jgi:hypothetical protein
MTVTPPQETYQGLVRRFRRSGTVRVDFREPRFAPTEAGRLTHDVHPYPAKLLRHIPGFFLRVADIAPPSATVLDPFCGSGTVLLEAQLNGHTSLGFDVNPLARLIARVKTTPISRRVLEDSMDRLARRALRKKEEAEDASPEVVNLHHWFYPHTIRDLSKLRRAISETRNESCRDFFWTCFSVCVRRVSLADPRISVPVRLRPDQYDRSHWLSEPTRQRLRQLRHINVWKEFASIVKHNTARMEKLGSERTSRPANVFAHDIRVAPPHKIARPLSLDTIITSPPYLGAQKYIRASSLSLNWLGLCEPAGLGDLHSASIGREHIRDGDTGDWSAIQPYTARLVRKACGPNKRRERVALAYLADMCQALESCERLLKEGGALVLVVGPNTLCGHAFDTPRILEHMAHRTGLTTELRLRDAIRSRGLMTRRNTTAGSIDTETVLVLRKTQ